MKRKPTPYATLLAQTRERHESAKKRLAADPTNPLKIKDVECLENDVRRL